MKKPRVPGSFAAWGKTSRKSTIFLRSHLSRAASLPGAELFPEDRLFFEEATCPGQLRCLGQNFQEFWDSSVQNKTSEIPKNGLSGTLGLLCAEQDVRKFKKCTFRISGTPVRRTRRRKSQKMDFQEFCDSCAQNKTSEISRNALSGGLGLLCAEQDVGNLKELHFQELRDSCALYRTSEISKTAVSGTLGLLCAEQDDENLKTCTFQNYVTPVRRTRRQKSQKIHFQEFWDSCAQNKTSEISVNALPGILGGTFRAERRSRERILP